MTTDESDATALREELRTVEEELYDLRRGVAEVRQRLGDRSEGATDAAELAMILTSVEEQEASIATLNARRDDLRRRLGEA
jgi:chromosome segregation ATPase